MTYALAAGLQTAIYGVLAADTGVQAVVGAHVYDAVPGGTLPQTYVVVGEEDVRPAGDVTGDGALHDIVISVISDAAGFADAKDAAGAVSTALDGFAPVLSAGRVVWLAFRRAKARRGSSPAARQIDLTFRVRIEAT